MLPEDGRYRLEAQFTPDSDEVEGERTVVFEGELDGGVADDGSFVAFGVLKGTFAIAADEEIESAATVRGYSRQGSLAFVSVVVGDETSRVTFAANLTPGEDEGRLGGFVVMGWPESVD
jgi:hypothetical protein